MRERKPRGSSLGVIRESVVNGVEGIGVYPNAGSLDDVKASVIAQMRADESIWWGVSDLSKTLGIDAKLVSKAVTSFSGIEDNGLQKRAKKYRLFRRRLMRKSQMTKRRTQMGNMRHPYSDANRSRRVREYRFAEPGGVPAVGTGGAEVNRCRWKTTRGRKSWARTTT